MQRRELLVAAALRAPSTAGSVGRPPGEALSPLANPANQPHDKAGKTVPTPNHSIASLLDMIKLLDSRVSQLEDDKRQPCHSKRDRSS